MTSEDFIIFGRPAIGEEEIQEVVECLRSGWIGAGSRVAQFESDFAAYKEISANHASAVNSPTAALHVSMLAANLEPGSLAITPPLTSCATVNAIIHGGLCPVLAYVDPRTHCIGPEAVDLRAVQRADGRVGKFTAVDIPRSIASGVTGLIATTLGGIEARGGPLCVNL